MSLKALIAPVFLQAETLNPDGTGPVALMAMAFCGVFDGTEPYPNTSGDPFVITARTKLLHTDGPAPLPPLVTDPRPRLVANLKDQFREMTGRQDPITVVWIDRGLA